MSSEERAACAAGELTTEAEALYAALCTRYGLIVRGDFAALQRTREQLAREDEALRALTLLGPDTQGQIWIVRKDKLGGAVG